MNDKRRTVLLAESREGPGSPVHELLKARNIEVLRYTDGIEAVRNAFSINPDLIVLDVALPRLSGYQCARVLKNDPFTSSIPVVHLGPSKSPIERFWSRVSGGDDYLQFPVDETALDRMLHRLIRKEGRKRRLLAPATATQNLDDCSILNLAANLLENNLLRASILNEINMLDVSVMPADELVMAVMGILDSLYDFTLGAALFIYDYRGELFFYEKRQADQQSLDEVKTLMVKHLDRHDVYLDPERIEQTVLLHSNEPKEAAANQNEIYIHANEGGRVHSVLALENIGLERFQREERELFMLALDHVNGVLGKKVLFQLSQQLSIIDAVTHANSMAFFMACLKREMEGCIRHRHPITLITISISNIADIAKDLATKDLHDLIRTVNSLILKGTRKSDIVARWEAASFAFLLTQTPVNAARSALERLCKQIETDLAPQLPSSAKPVINVGLCEYSPEQHKTPEIFFAEAKPTERHI